MLTLIELKTKKQREFLADGIKTLANLSIGSSVFNYLECLIKQEIQEFNLFIPLFGIIVGIIAYICALKLIGELKSQ